MDGFTSKFKMVEQRFSQGRQLIRNIQTEGQRFKRKVQNTINVRDMGQQENVQNWGSEREE